MNGSIIFSLSRQNEDLRSKLAKLEGSDFVSSESAKNESKRLKDMHEKECRELRLTIKSLVRSDATDKLSK